MIKIISITLLLLLAVIRGHAQTETAKVNFKALTFESGTARGLEAWVTQPEQSGYRFHLRIYNPGGKRVRITLGGNEMEYLLDETFTGTVFLKVYNLSQMEDGTYNFQISSGKEKITKTVAIRTETTSRRIIEVK